MKFWSSFSVIMLVCGAVLGQNKPNATPLQTYSNAQKGITLQLPANWIKKEVPETVFFFKRPKEEAGQTFAENISLITNPPDDLSLEEYATVARNKLREQIAGFHEVKFDYIKINKRQFFRIIYSFTYGSNKMKDIYYVTMKDGCTYDFTCSALETTFKRFFPVFEKIMHSCIIK
jgi:hypothetical protein